MMIYIFLCMYVCIPIKHHSNFLFKIAVAIFLTYSASVSFLFFQCSYLWLNHQLLMLIILFSITLLS